MLFCVDHQLEEAVLLELGARYECANWNGGGLMNCDARGVVLAVWMAELPIARGQISLLEG
jgi:hypothetical protein